MSISGHVARCRFEILVLSLVCLVLLPSAPAGAGMNEWTASGPFGGSVSVVAPSPSFATDRTIFAGASGGRIYKTTDGGDHWAPSASGIVASDFVSCIAISPAFSADQTLFAGANGLGRVYKSTDGGATWVIVYYGDIGHDIRALAISPNFAVDRTIFVGTATGVYRSTNAGTSWTAVNTGLSSSNRAILALAISPDFAADNTVFAGVGGALYKLMGGGTVWGSVSFGAAGTSPVPNGLESIAISPAYALDRTLYAGRSDGILKSADAGATWVRVDSYAYGVGVDSLALSPNYPVDGTLFASYKNGSAYRIENNEATWTPITVAPDLPYTYGFVMSPDFANDRTVLATNSGGVYKSADAGATWIEVNSGIVNSYVYALAVPASYASDHTLFAGTGSHGVLRSTDGGVSWAAVNSGLGERCVTALAASPAYAADATLFAAGSGIGVFKTSDGGASWSAASVGLADASIYSLAISPNYAIDRTVFAGGGGLSLFKTVDDGATWEQVFTAPSPILSLAVSPSYASDLTAFLGTRDHGVYRSTDGGAFWMAVNSGISDFDPLMSDMSIKSLGVSPSFAADHTVFAGTTYAGMFKTTNGGLHWDHVLGYIGGPTIGSVAFSPGYAADRTVFAGTGGGLGGGATSSASAIFTSTDGGSTWTGMNDGIPAQWYLSLEPTLAVSPDFANDRRVFAGTRGYGVMTYDRHAPTAANDLYQVPFDGVLAVPAPGVLANDTDAAGHPLTAILAGGPSRGSLSLESDGSFTYTPDGSGSGFDSFNYRANDGAVDSPIATVAITITRKAPVLTWENPPDVVFGTALGEAQLAAAADVGGAFAYTPPAGTVLGAGPGQALSVTFTPTDAGRYESVSGSVVLNVLKRGQTISFAPLADKTRGAPDFAVSAAADSGLPVSFTAAGVCTVSGGAVHLTGAGSCTVTAHQAGDANHHAAADVSRGFTVLPAGPDLVEVSISNPPVAIRRGGTFSVMDVTANAGDVATTGDSTTRYYLSRNKSGTIASKRLRGGRTVAALGPGASSADAGAPVQRRRPVTVPTSTRVGMYYLLGCADNTGVVAESNESNNCLASRRRVVVK